MKILYSDTIDDSFFQYREIEELSQVSEIIGDVRRDGDRAVQDYTARFDGVHVEQLKVSLKEIEEAYEQIGKASIDVLRQAADNIEKFALKQKEAVRDFEYEIQPGVVTGQKVIPIERVGVYAPGGNAPLPSTVLMCALPARVAGVQDIVVCSPPSHGGTIHPAILVAAVLCDVSAIYKVGGVQAIAAMAYGTESIRPVDKIVGPGNKYVTAAKRLVYGTVCIDFIAGPTELMIIADEGANPSYVAADLLAQAEHDIHAIPVLITDSPGLANQVALEVETQLPRLKTGEIAERSLHDNGMIIIVSDLDEAVELANRRAPEHLELQVENVGQYVDRLKHYGSLFIGRNATEVLGDYSSGLNHTLPTNTTARYTGGLSVHDFLKIQTTLRVTPEGLEHIGPMAEQLGELEGLDGHAKSVRLRLDS